MNAVENDERYHIRPDYVPNLASRTLDGDDHVFWRPERIRSSEVYQWHVYKLAVDLIREHGIRTVLDVGCGPATKLMRLIAPIADVIGIDQASAVEFCRRRYDRGTFMVDDFENPAIKLDVAPGLVICSDVIEHIHDPDVLLNYLKRLATPDTLLLLSTPDRERFRGRRALQCPKSEHVREWSQPELASYLESRGFRILLHRHFPPVRLVPSRYLALQLGYQWGHGRAFRYNQAALCRLAS